MAYAGKFVGPIRKTLAVITFSSSSSPAISQSRQLFYARFEPLKRWIKGLEPTLHNRAARLHCKLNIQRGSAYNVCSSGKKLSIGDIFGLSLVFGSISIWGYVAYAMHGHDVLVGDFHGDLLGASDVEDDPHALLRSARKFWMPVFFILTVLMNWENPIVLSIKLILFLLSTKPSPLSVYLLVEKLCYHFMRVEPHLYKQKSLYAKKVEIQDYKLLCVAEVEVQDRKLKLLGILGGWWVLPSFTSEEAMSVFRYRTAMKHYIERTR